MNTVVDKELAIHDVFRYANAYAAGMRLVASSHDAVDLMVSAARGTPAAFDLLIEQKEQVINVMIEP